MIQIKFVSLVNRQNYINYRVRTNYVYIKKNNVY